MGNHLRHDLDFLGYRGKLMTLRSLNTSGLNIRTHLWTFESPLIHPFLMTSTHLRLGRERRRGHRNRQGVWTTALEALFAVAASFDVYFRHLTHGPNVAVQPIPNQRRGFIDFAPTVVGTMDIAAPLHLDCRTSGPASWPKLVHFLP